jgi:hypothetical protein
VDDGLGEKGDGEGGSDGHGQQDHDTEKPSGSATRGLDKILSCD